MKGIIRFVPVKAVSEGTLVMTENGQIWNVQMMDIKRFALRSIDDNHLNYERFSLDEWKDGLKKIIIEYEECCSENGNQNCEGSDAICKMSLKRLPLKYSDWKRVFTDNLFDKEVDFEIEFKVGIFGVDKTSDVQIATLNLKQNKTYTKKELEQFGFWLLKNNHSVWSMEQLVNQWEYDTNNKSF